MGERLFETTRVEPDGLRIELVVQPAVNGDATTPAGVTVARFEPDSPWTGASTLATVGLSRHHLAQSANRGLHQELLMHFAARTSPAMLRASCSR